MLLHISATPRERRRASGTPYAAYFTQLLGQVDPHRPADGQALPARTAAGRWLALRRHELGLSSAQLVELTGVGHCTLLLLETGLAEPTLASQEAWVRLVEVLTGEEPTATCVIVMLASALGYARVLCPSSAAQVEEDLGTFIAWGGAERRREAAAVLAHTARARRAMASNWLYRKVGRLFNRFVRCSHPYAAGQARPDRPGQRRV